MSERRLPDPHRALIRALALHLPGMAVERSSSEPWASVTFTGARHAVRLSAAEAVTRDFAARAGDIEFALPGHIVADIVVVRLSGTEIEIEALTIEDR